MRYLPQADWCATLSALFTYKGALLADAYARLPDDQATWVLETRGLSLSPDFRALSWAQAEAALHALRRYRSSFLSGNL